MSSYIFTRVTAYGDSIEVRTPKDTPDAQHVHTVKYFEAYNELRRREADRVESFNDHAAGLLREPVKMHSRENPGGLIRGSKYLRTDRTWKPVFPLATWKAPKPVSDRAALVRARKLDGKSETVRYESVGQITFEELPQP